MPQQSPTTAATPLVTVAVASYNLDRYIEQALASVRDQTYQTWECVIVDDGSRDKSAEIAESFSSADPRFRTFRQANQGASITRNRGCELASQLSKYILFLDSDDYLYPDSLEVLVEYLEHQLDVVAVYTDSLIIDASGEPLPELQQQFSAKRYVPRGLLVSSVDSAEPNTEIETLLAYMTARPSNTLFRKKHFERAGGWDQRAFPWDDNDLMARLLSEGRVHYLPLVKSTYRIHGHNASKTLLNSEAYQYYRAKLWNLPGASEAHVGRVRRSMMFERYVESMLCVRQALLLTRRREFASIGFEIGKGVRAFGACAGMGLCHLSGRLFGRSIPVWRLFSQLDFCRPHTTQR